MQRIGIPLGIALLVAVIVIGIRNLGGEDAPELPIDLEPIAVTHSTEDGLTVRVVNNSDNDYVGDVRVQVLQANRSVTLTLQLELPAFGVDEGLIGGDWDAGEGSLTIQLELDPQADLNDTARDNDAIVVQCPLADATCKLQ